MLSVAKHLLIDMHVREQILHYVQDDKLVIFLHPPKHHNTIMPAKAKSIAHG
ncbi:MAG: hypothetical protein JWR38_998 [Mucilaginibacter sp.]|nr:hypothetical protein [Mucilaginibacter sp.]